MVPSNESPGTPTQGQQPSPPRHGFARLATWAIIVLLIVVLGVGMLGGWLLGRNASTAGDASSTSVPPTQTSADQDALRVKVIEKFRPAVVQINVTTHNGQGGLGSGTIIDP